MARGGATNEHGLTQKQEAFALHFVEHGNAAEAYRHAYDAKENLKDHWVHVEASQVLNTPEVSLRVNALREEAAKLVFFGVKEAFEELNDATAMAKAGKNATAMVSAAGKKMELFGLGSKGLRLSGKVETENGDPAEDAAKLVAAIPVLNEMLKAQGYEIVPISPAGDTIG